VARSAERLVRAREFGFFLREKPKKRKGAEKTASKKKKKKKKKNGLREKG